MFKILDRYIIRKFLGTYIFAIVLILAITVMFDINEKLDAFLKAPLKATVFDYFLNFLPYFLHIYCGDILHIQACRQFRDNSDAVVGRQL